MASTQGDVTAFLYSSPPPAASSSGTVFEKAAPVLTRGPDSELNKLKRKLAEQQSQIQNLKKAKGKVKGKDKGKGKNKTTPKASADLGRRVARSDANENICFNFNRPVGCPLAGDGGTCPRGRHVCLECHGNHSLSLPCPRLSR